MARLTARARQVLAEDRRSQIMEAAADVFSRRGYHGATIRQIARRAGLAEGTVYLYFPSKRDVLVASWEHVALSTIVPLLDRAAAIEDDEAFLTALVTNRLDVLRRHAAFFRLVLQQADVDPALHKALQERIQAIKTLVGGYLRQRIGRGAFRRVSVPVVMRAVAGMMMGIALIDAHDPEPLFAQYSVEAVAREVSRILLYGLRADTAGAPGWKRVAPRRLAKRRLAGRMAERRMVERGA
jgi:AcrR family transcriptional regulator